MIIEKKQKDPLRYTSNWTFYRAAREGLKAILLQEKTSRGKILLPAYIGYSSNEGSGVFDPVKETETPFLFYRLNGKLQINIDDLAQKIKKNPGAMLLLIHYFGFEDKNIDAIKALAKSAQMLIIEDFAHAFFTFWRYPSTLFDYGIFSLHKLFPLKAGGAILSQKEWPHPTGINYDLFRYNFSEIADKRCENFLFILNKLSASATKKYPFTLIHDSIDGTVPQSFPLLLPDEQLRDILYFRMNEAGYGLVSLYHELIKEIDLSFKAEHDVAKRIINLPVHQDADIDNLSEMLDIFLKIIDDQLK